MGCLLTVTEWWLQACDRGLCCGAAAGSNDQDTPSCSLGVCAHTPVLLTIALSAGCAAAGWKFWVPAASLNFYAVPLQYQVGLDVEHAPADCVL